MDNYKYIEDFRLNEYLLVYFALLSDSKSPKIELTFNNYALHGFYSTSEDINDLENGKTFINNGRKSLLSISLWYLSLESYINSICKITSLVNGTESEPIINMDISSRLNYLLKTLGYDELSIKKSGIYNRVNEFRQFRNEIFHDRNIGDEIKFKKANFSTIPTQSNQVDIFQSMKIFIEVATLFRYSIPGLDLMPNISIGNANVLHFEKLDVLYLKYLKPYFENTLKKLNLKTKLDLEIHNFNSLSPSNLFNVGEIVIITRIEQEEKFSMPLEIVKTNIGKDLYHKIISEYNLPDGHTSGLNFTVDWPDFYKSKFPMRR